jgi:hypothetical protein
LKHYVISEFKIGNPQKSRRRGSVEMLKQVRGTTVGYQKCDWPGSISLRRKFAAMFSQRRRTNVKIAARIMRLKLIIFCPNRWVALQMTKIFVYYAGPAISGLRSSYLDCERWKSFWKKRRHNGCHERNQLRRLGRWPIAVMLISTSRFRAIAASRNLVN